MTDRTIIKNRNKFLMALVETIRIESMNIIDDRRLASYLRDLVPEESDAIEIVVVFINKGIGSKMLALVKDAHTSTDIEQICTRQLINAAPYIDKDAANQIINVLVEGLTVKSGDSNSNALHHKSTSLFEPIKNFFTGNHEADSNPMGLKRYKVVTFSEDDKVVVLENVNYDGRYFVYVNEITPDESDVTDVYKIMEIHPEDWTLEKVTDPKLLTVLGPLFTKKLKKYW